MMSKKNTDTVDRPSSQRTINEHELAKANGQLDEFINNCSSEVFRAFLPSISQKYKVIPNGIKVPISETVAYFRISKFVGNEEERMVDCLKSVYHVLANSGCGVALIIRRTQNECEFGLAVGNPTGKSERTIKDTERLKDAFLGNFPGSVCSDVCSYNDNDSDSSLFKHISSKYCGVLSLASVSNIATEFTEDYLTQGIEKLLDGIRPSNPEKEYTLVILGEALKDDELNKEKENLYTYYTSLSPFASEQKNLSISEVNQTNQNLSAILLGHSWGKSYGNDESTSIDVTNYKVKHTLEVIEKQMKRLEEAAALGLWNFSAYVISPDLAVTNEVAHLFMSLTQGRESFAEQPAINVWNGQDEKECKKIAEILSYLRHLKHPLFFNESIDKKVTATTIVSGAEFARSLSFPQKSVPGFPVFKCARFGRNISTYNDSKFEPVALGHIYHMRQEDKATPVLLNKNSLTSHVFITGSTGSGKSNTVFQILKQSNIPFLVIEPAKGEYKDVFGGYEKVRVFGTNPKQTELLKINPFSFPDNISVSEHIDRLVELFNVCWPMYAAMPAILKDSIIKAYEASGWEIETSENKYEFPLYPTFVDVLHQIRRVLESSDYSADNKSDYTGALVTRLRSLTNGINGQIFSSNELPNNELFDSKVIIDLSRIGSTETRSMIMGLLIMKLQEYRLSDSKPDNCKLRHITVLEEAHNILKRTSTEQTSESANLLGKSVEMLTNAIAELRAFGEGFIIADQAPGLLDMAVIRNTNTKIIHRLPDQSDRELSGKAAGLSSDQIDELAKLELGVAAIYQNEWIEPILCKVAELQSDEKKQYSIPSIYSESNCTNEAKRMVRDVLLNPTEFIKVDMALIYKSNLPAQVKIMMIEMNKGHIVREDVKAKIFYMLYHNIHLSMRKDEKGEYLTNLYMNIAEVCGQLTPSELKIASVYVLAVSRGFSRIGTEEYSEIRKELMSHD